MTNHRIYEDVLRRVQKPGRYTGGEWNQIKKDPRKAGVKVALVFPDLYEVGMSYLGQKILYARLNEQPEVLAERIFAPWPDFEQVLRSQKIPLVSLENKIPLDQFDILGFSLLYELNFSNVLTILDLGRVPLFAAQRDLDQPLVIGGGPAAFNPEPLAELFDFFLVGDGEEAFPEIVEKYLLVRENVRTKAELLRIMAGIDGVYVPSLYSVEEKPSSFYLIPRPKEGAPKQVMKRTIHPFHRSFIPEDIVVPNIQAIHDRVAVEAARGCPQRCRFCQATSLYLPFRMKSPSHIIEKMLKSLRSTGYEDCSLTALSISDYPYLDETVRLLMKELEKQKISLSLSSLRPKGLSADIISSILKVRKTGFTLVPEAGTERLRRVINKNLEDKEIWEASTNAFSRGWRLLKLYFMIGLPTEREEDLEGIIELVKEVARLGRTILGSPPRINMSVSSFIPKPHTPFQWLAMEDEQTLIEKQGWIRSRLRKYRFIEIKEHPVKISLLEGVFSRGDRRLAGALVEAWKNGARFDSWRDQFRFSAWEDAFSACEIPYRQYLAARDPDSPLPWDLIQTGIKPSHLRRELEKALREETTPSCLENKCGQCQGCDLFPMLEKTFSEEIRVNAEDLSFFGEPSPDPIRYRAFYSKTGEARFLSHIDLINLIQRAFRRARLSVLQSEGFHPKMLISYLPALPLGMEGKAEALEFRSSFVFEEREFVPHLNRHLPSGVEFKGLTRLDNTHPSLSEDVQGMVYALDLRNPVVEEAIKARAFENTFDHFDRDAVLEALVNAYPSRAADPSGSRMTVDRKREELVIRLRWTSQKNERPQDIVETLLGLGDSVYFMSREKILFRGDSPEIDRTG